MLWIEIKKNGKNGMSEDLINTPFEWKLSLDRKM